jgi:hydroxymethylpyrimidine/phosphomethylpyrimidine kinase
MATALTIAGSDSSGRAGIQADLLTFAALGVEARTAITAITAQHAAGVSAIAPLPTDIVTAQIEAAAADGAIGATKIGMLATAAIVEAVAAAIEELELPLVVLDPVLASSSGARLIDADGVQAMLTELLSLTFVITPNIPEAEALSGRRIASMDDLRAAARRIRDMGPENVIVKGGHAGQSPEGNDVIDLLFDGRSFHEMRVPRVNGPSVGGTGCRFASAVAAFLALGHALPEAAARAQQYVAAVIGGSVRV